MASLKRVFVAAGFLLAAASIPAGASAWRNSTTQAYDETSLVDASVPNLATFQSHNTRAVYVPGAGIFLAYVVSETGVRGTLTDTSQQRVAFTADNGAHWKTLLNLPLIRGDWPPSLETDRAGNVYAFLGFGPPGLHGARMYKFSPPSYTHPTLYKIGDAGANTDKWASAYDPATNHLYYVKGDGSTGSFRLYTIDAASGKVLQDVFLLRTTPRTYPHYPHIYIARDDSGLILLAWTNTLWSNNGYHDIHYLVSSDHGRSWIGRSGTIPRSAYPVDPTNAGPSFPLMRHREYTADTYRWLANIYVQDRKLYFVYSGEGRGADPLWFRRVDWATRTRDLFSGPATNICGGSICLANLSAFFSGTGRSGSRIYLTSGTAGGDRVGTLYSDDGGATWHGYTVSRNGRWGWPYGISGSHRLGPGGEIFGAFTGETGTKHSGNRLEFFRLRRK